MPISRSRSLVIALVLAAALGGVVVATPAPPDLCTTLGGHSVAAVDQNNNPVTATIFETFGYKTPTKIDLVITATCSEYQQASGSDYQGPNYKIQCSIVQQLVYPVVGIKEPISPTNPVCPSGSTSCYSKPDPGDFPISTSGFSWTTTLGGYGACADQALQSDCGAAYVQWENTNPDMTNYVPPTVDLPPLPAPITISGACCVGVASPTDGVTLPPRTSGAGIGSGAEIGP
jgi:hypothetical protein